MAQRIGTTVTAPMRINDDTIPYPIAYANEIQGGAQSVATLAQMDAIPVWNRQFGMSCRVYNDGANNGNYILTYGNSSTNLADNGNWVLESSAASSGNIKKLDASILNVGTIQLPANCFFIAIVINAGADLPALNVGYTSGAGDLLMTQDCPMGYQTWNKGIFIPASTTIYFSGVSTQSTCSLIFATF